MGRALLIVNTEADRQKASHWVSRAPWGARITFQSAKRSVDQNSLMWAALTDVAQQVEHMGQRYTPDEWKILFMHACGREVRFLPGLDGKTFVPWGQSTSDLSKQEMTDLIEFIFAWGAERGVKFNEPSAEPHSSGEEGSGEASPPSPAADQSAEAVEAGEPEVEHPASMAPASEFTKADCLKAFMITSTDTGLSVSDRRDVLEQMKDWWKEALPNHLDFVRSCLTTADKIVKGELQADAARRYLEGLLS